MLLWEEAMSFTFKDLDALLEVDGAHEKDEVEAEHPCVLVVDDDATIRESLGLLLRKRYRPILCASAREAVDAMSDTICAAILDIKMGKHDGFWACNQIRSKSPDLPVIFYSAYQDAKDPYDIINEHRPFGYLTKGYDPKRLLETVDLAVSFYSRLLEGKRLLDRYKQHYRKGV
jgi:DNA-binding NtrC family response regulator